MTKNTDLEELKVTTQATTEVNRHSNKPQGGAEADSQPFSITLLKCLAFSQKLRDVWKNKIAQSREEKNKADNQETEQAVSNPKHAQVTKGNENDASPDREYHTHAHTH